MAKKTDKKRRLIIPVSEMWSELYRIYNRHLRRRAKRDGVLL